MLGQSAAFVSPLRSSREHRQFQAKYHALRVMSFENPSNLAPLLISSDELIQQGGNLQIEPLSPTTNIIVFIIGIIPFIWATYEFWRRIAVGASFGTGKDSVIIPSPFSSDSSSGDAGRIMIGEDNNPNSSRGRQTLDRGALTVAYVLFAIAGGSIAIALASVVMSPQQPPSL
jgi:hypothetical protein